MYAGKRRGSTSKALRERKRKIKDAAHKSRQVLKKWASSGGDTRGDESGKGLAGDSDMDEEEEEEEEGDEEDEGAEEEEEELGGGRKEFMFSSFRWSNRGKFGFDSRKRKYETDDVGRLRDLVSERRKGKREMRLKVECLRPPTSVTTTVSDEGGARERGMLGKKRLCYLLTGTLMNVSGRPRFCEGGGLLRCVCMCVFFLFFFVG